MLSIAFKEFSSWLFFSITSKLKELNLELEIIVEYFNKSLLMLFDASKTIIFFGFKPNEYSDLS